MSVEDAIKFHVFNIANSLSKCAKCILNLRHRYTGQAVCTTLFRIGYISMHDVYFAVNVYAMNRHHCNMCICKTVPVDRVDFSNK